MEAILNYQSRGFIISIGIIASLLISYLTITVGLVAPVLSLVLCSVLVFLIIVFRNPFIGLMSALVYTFIVGIFDREISGLFSFGYIVEILYATVWIAIIFKCSKGDWSRLNNDLCILFLIWFLISVLQIINPAGASVRGWVSEIRSSGLDSFMLVPAGFMLFRNVKHLNIFLIIIIAISFLGAVNGIKQLHIGLSPGEEEFLRLNPTHSIWGQLRVFSFYRDAGQFGASQAHLALICIVLALGPFKVWKRLTLLFFAGVFFYGMLISGTRGSLFVLIFGTILALFLFKNVKVLILGVILTLLFVAVLKFTYIGSSYYHIRRLRTSLSIEDPSLNSRFMNQKILSEYMKAYPFGGGLGVIGYAGDQYNSDKFLSTIAPDSYWVKVWVMYGIVGLSFWFSMIMYIIGKGCGIVWNIRDRKLQVKLIALISGFFGIFISSYGNEVINTLPSSIIVYLSLVLIYLGPYFDKSLAQGNKPLRSESLHQN